MDDTGAEHSIIVPSVWHVRIDGFLEKNIINEFRIYAAHQCTHQLVKQALIDMHPAAEAYVDIVFQKLGNANGAVIDLISSLGASLTMISHASADDILRSNEIR